MPADPRRVKELFGEAISLPDAAARAAYLNRECGDDAALRQKLDVLLKAHDQPASALDRPLAGEYTGAYVSEERAAGFIPAEAGTIIAGKYKLVELIGEGGMGSVWLAEQSEPVRRRVAVKLIKAGMDSRQVIARFEAERQALAVMDHPNIAKVLDGGLHDNRPYFVMELVKGVPITQYCDAHKLTPRQRLELFVPVCQAIQHAHQKGIIHRDIKPSNVLIAPYDDKPVPKVIDFGLAKATGVSLTDASMATNFGGVVGTPQYMSPEQASLNNLDIDTRSDVYSLGVLLYELLTGSPPFKRKDLEKAGMFEILRVIREEEPPKPSTKLSTADALPSLSAQRGMDPAKLTGLLRNELDWIVMKALEKDRARRYETANGFAADINRYLAGEPVVAHPPSAGYRVKKFVRKNRGAVMAASAVFLAVLTGAGVATWQAVRAETARKAEADQRLVAERERDIAVAVREFLQDDLLGQAGSTAQADRRSEQKPNLTIKEALDRAAAAVGGKFHDRPELEASIRQTIGNAYREVGQFEKAIAQLQQSADIFKRQLGPDHGDTLESFHDLAGAFRDAGKTIEAVDVLRQVCATRAKRLGENHHDTMASLNNLALAYRDLGKTSEAIVLFEQVRDAFAKELGPSHAATLAASNNLALAYDDVGKTDAAIRLYEQVRDEELKTLGADHPSTLITLNNLAMAYKTVGKTSKAAALLEQLCERQVKCLGPDHPDTLTTLHNLATTLHATGKTLEAIALLERVRNAQTRRLGPDHADTLTTLNSLGIVLLGQKRFADAEPLLVQCYDGLKQRQDKIRPVDGTKRLTEALDRLIKLYDAWDKPAEAAKWRAELEKVRSKNPASP